VNNIERISSLQHKLIHKHVIGELVVGLPQGPNAYLAVENLVDRKANSRALKSKSFSKKSLSLIACRMPKPPMTPDDINALSKAWNESKAATDAVLAKFREGASKDEIDDAIRKMYATRGKVQEFHDKFFEN
jgi:Xaa-Pro aminopeptidase